MEPELKVSSVRQVWPEPEPLDVAGRVRELLREQQLTDRIGALGRPGEGGAPGEGYASDEGGGREAARPRDEVAARGEGRPRSEVLDRALPPDDGGPRVALTAGSRGVRDLVTVLRTAAEELKRLGCRPFVAPCMGSHGGATASGQLVQLADLGVTEASVGAPLISSMDVVAVATSSHGTPAYVGRDLVAAEGVVVVNRIKPHTDFTGEIGSGIVKMMVIGMGKHRGAETAHRLALRHGFVPVLEETAGLILEHLPVLCGLGIVEDQRDRTVAIELLDTAHGLAGLLPREAELQRQAERLMPRLPFDSFDILLVDRMGKEVSGAGMDCNVIGRRAPLYEDQLSRPRIMRVYVRELTLGSHGNATGIGMADFVSRRLLDQVDRRATWVNCLTSASPEDGRLPIAFDTDREAVAACLDSCGVQHAAEARLVWIRDTADLETIWVSEALRAEVEAAGEGTLQIAGPAVSLPFDERGDLVSPFAAR